LTRINLLPPERIKARRGRAPSERSYWWILPILPIIVIIALGFWYVSLNSQLSNKDKALTASKAELADWQAKNAALQQYKARQDQIAGISQTIVTALSGRVYWARILNDIAILLPSDVWLTSLSGSSSEGAGAAGTVQFSAFALQCPNREQKGGTFIYYPDYRPVAGWLDRMAQVPEFSRIWLGSAAPAREGVSGAVTPEGQTVGPWTIGFTSTAYLNMQVAAISTVQSTTPTTTTPTPSSTPSSTPSTTPSTPSTSGGSGGEAR